MMSRYSSMPPCIAHGVLQVGHHVDLMFSNEADPPELTEARVQEKALLRKWLQQFEGRACSSC